MKVAGGGIKMGGKKGTKISSTFTQGIAGKTGRGKRSGGKKR